MKTNKQTNKPTDRAITICPPVLTGGYKNRILGCTECKGSFTPYQSNLPIIATVSGYGFIGSTNIRETTTHNTPYYKRNFGTWICIICFQSNSNMPSFHKMCYGSLHSVHPKMRFLYILVNTGGHIVIALSVGLLVCLLVCLRPTLTLFIIIQLLQIAT